MLYYEGMNEKLTLISKIGNFVSNILLGETKEIILRTDEKVRFISRTIDEEMRPDLKEIREKFSGIEVKVEELWKFRLAPGQSPRQLNEDGERILTESGIKDIIETRKSALLELVKQKGAENPYDAEQNITSVVAELPKRHPDLLHQLKEGAFKTGVSVDTVLFVGGVHLRNLIFKELGYDLVDLDKPQGKSE